MSNAFADLLGRMIIQTEINLVDLRIHAEQRKSGTDQRRAINEVIHAELLRLDMLKNARSDIAKF
jgi:hypothetical protein